jgi:prevent-host-death family protein
MGQFETPAGACQRRQAVSNAIGTVVSAPLDSWRRCWRHNELLAKIAKMSKSISASDAKNNFGGLLEDVAALGRVDIVKHGRLVAVVLSPRTLESAVSAGVVTAQDGSWGKNHMIPPSLARAARMLNRPSTFDEE